MGEIRVGVELEVEIGDEPTEVERERRREVQKWQIARCWEVLSSVDPGAWFTLGTRETEEKSAAPRFTSLSPGKRCIVLRGRALVSRPPVVLLGERWIGMDECMISTVWRCLTEGGGGRGTGSSCDYPLG